MEPAQVQLYLDYAETHTPALVLTDSYALMEECIETPRLILLRKDEERLLILPPPLFCGASGRRDGSGIFAPDLCPQAAGEAQLAVLRGDALWNRRH